MQECTFLESDGSNREEYTHHHLSEILEQYPNIESWLQSLPLAELGDIVHVIPKMLKNLEMIQSPDPKEVSPIDLHCALEQTIERTEMLATVERLKDPTEQEKLDAQLQEVLMEATNTSVESLKDWEYARAHTRTAIEISELASTITGNLPWNKTDYTWKFACKQSAVCRNEAQGHLERACDILTYSPENSEEI